MARVISWKKDGSGISRRTSSCGICGKASIDAVRLAADPIQSEISVAPGVLHRLPALLRAAQDTFDRTGALHAAGLFDVAANSFCSGRTSDATMQWTR